MTELENDDHGMLRSFKDGGPREPCIVQASRRKQCLLLNAHNATRTQRLDKSGTNKTIRRAEGVAPPKA